MKYYFIAYERDLSFINKEGKEINYAKIVLVKVDNCGTSLEVYKATRDLTPPSIYSEVHPLYDEKGRVAFI